MLTPTPISSLNHIYYIYYKRNYAYRQSVALVLQD